MCPDGTDSFDCGECSFTNDGYCDDGDLSPPGTGPDDSCATPDGTDAHD